MNISKKTFYIGLNDQKTKTQLISTDSAVDYVANIMVDFAGGCTISTAKGYYKHIDGALCFENTIKCEVFFMDEETALKAIQIFKDAFNQETIALQRETVDSDLI